MFPSLYGLYLLEVDIETCEPSLNRSSFFDKFYNTNSFVTSRKHPHWHIYDIHVFGECTSTGIHGGCFCMTTSLLVSLCHVKLHTSGLTGSSMPTTQMQVNPVRISFSLSQSGSPSEAGKSLYARQMVLRPSEAMGSITFFTMSSLSRGRNTFGSPFAVRTL